MPTISSLGIGSGLDLNSLLTQLEDAESQKLTPITQQQRSYRTELSAFGRLESALGTLRDTVRELSDPSSFKAISSEVSGDAFTATTDSEAVAGRYQVEVSQLAQAQTLASGGQASRTDAIALDGGGAGTLTLAVGGESFDIQIDDSNNTLDGIRDAINASDAGVTASIVNDGSDQPYRLVISSEATGTDSAIQISSTDSALQAAFGYDGDSTNAGNGMSQTVAAQDAKLRVNGIDISSQSNTVEGALQGVTLTVDKVTSGPESLSVAQDDESITGSINAFVKAYNDYVSLADSLTSYNAAEDSAGALLGNASMRGIESRLRGAMSFDSELDGVFNMLSDVGIELQLDGTLEVDDDKLNAAVKDSSGDVSALFAGIDREGGFAGQLEDTLDSILDSGGVLETATDGIDSTLTRLDDRYDRVQASIDATVERYRSQFQQLDAVMAQMQSTSSYLSQQLSSLQNQSN
ncbi:flagellar filament capping protein FliD [Salinicola avicenniae]|uniref:flagellar filament capping protein FliD n=1 Tax=Salinicola avicenniae TaxID=2916836 RepID=UPI002072FD9D|nr:MULTISPECIES: flagellar filament capping protein FliD [unclassified Salinicola]